MTNDFDALDSALDEGSNGSEDTTSSSNVEERPWMKMTPRVAVTGTVTAISFSGSIKSEQNIRGGDMGGDYRISLNNPRVELGNLYENTDRNGELVRTTDATKPSGKAENIDYRLVDSSDRVFDELVEERDGEYVPVGIELDWGGAGAKFYGEETDEFSDDSVDIFVGKRAGRLIAQGLDAFGATSAFYDDEGNKSNGMIEYHPNHGDDGTPNPRQARTPTLHPELEGEEITIYLRHGDEYNGNRATLGHVFLNDADDITERTELTGNSLDHFDEPSESDVDDLYPPWMVWHNPDDDNDGNSGGAAAEATDDGDEDNFSSLDAATSSDETSIDDLTDQQREFVEQAIEVARESGGFDAAFDDFGAAVEGAVDNGEIESIDAETMTNIVRSEA